MRQRLQEGLDVNTIRKALQKLDWKPLPFRRLSSTNDYAKKLLRRKDKAHGYLVIAEEQTQGRGRYERRWQSKPFLGLWFSLILRAQNSTRLSLLPFAAALSIAQAIEKDLNLGIQLKWPNDLLCKGKKFCGILSESTSDGYNDSSVILGIGINVNHQPLDFDLMADKPTTSLAIESGKVIDRTQLLINICRSLAAAYWDFEQGNFDTIINGWKERCHHLNKRITLSGEKVHTGLFGGIDEIGRLVLITDEGETRKFSVGDVSFSELPR